MPLYSTAAAVFVAASLPTLDVLLGMLPGRRTYTDEDIIGQLGECLEVFSKVEDAWNVPEDLRGLVFQYVAQMVAQRTAPAPGMAAVLEQMKRDVGA